MNSSKIANSNGINFENLRPPDSPDEEPRSGLTKLTITSGTPRTRQNSAKSDKLELGLDSSVGRAPDL